MISINIRNTLSPPVVGSLGSLATARLPLTKLLAHRTKTTAWNRCVDRWWRLKTKHRQAVDMTFWCFSIEMRVTSRRQHSNLQTKNAFAPLWFRNRSYVEPNNTFPLLYPSRPCSRRFNSSLYTACSFWDGSASAALAGVADFRKFGPPLVRWFLEAKLGLLNICIVFGTIKITVRPVNGPFTRFSSSDLIVLNIVYM